MKKLLLILGIITLITSMSMCITSKNIDDLKKEIVIEFNGTPVKVPLRTTIGEAKEVKLINTTDKEIYDYYHSKILIYIYGNMSLKPDEGGISIVDLITKLEWFNQFYPHNIVVELERTNSTVTVKSIFANGKTSIDKLKINESEYLMNNNKTMVIKIIKTQNNATIMKINNTFIIEGNSLKEMDKAETRFIIALFKGNIN
ncbi:hypothetical protein JH146_0165 [Methanocaldococcus bathoardescens]|uniref:Uncharacterized protein n=1 Tax=Methanocaldococcus bathoardescens TaxID=1301915 RepID=A0A076LA31_9EURY|nr:hypothetical protein [Methanocaldococcus bathoardescens]AIJ05016.1 hypothetical protein JH146_0165 [Methanocaldococcus bathoardescens]